MEAIKDPTQPLLAGTPQRTLQRFVILCHRNDGSVEVFNDLYSSATDALKHLSYKAEYYKNIRLSVAPVSIPIAEDAD